VKRVENSNVLMMLQEEIYLNFMYSTSKILINYHPLQGHISNALRKQNTNKLSPSREAPHLIRPDFKCTEMGGLS
jgi:hypothetical protein